jgi:hypothetical protein
MNHRKSLAKMYHPHPGLIVVTLISAGLLWGCSNEPSEEETATPQTVEETIPDYPPSVTVALPEMNILYRGYDNQIVAVTSGFDSTVVSGNNILLETNMKNSFPHYTGRIKGKTDIITLDIAGYNASTKETLQMGVFNYKVSDLPEGNGFLGNAGSGDKINEGETTLSVKPVTGLGVQPVYTVKSWEAHCAAGSFSGKGNQLSPDAKTGIHQSRKGSVVSILITYESTDDVKHMCSLIVRR